MTLRIADLDDDAPTRDALATWLLGHGQRISFGKPYVRGRRVLVDAVVHVPCKHLRAESAAGAGEAAEAAGRVRCAAHAFVGPMPPTRQPPQPPSLRNGAGALAIVYRGRQRRLDLATLEILAPASRRHSDHLEALLLARRSPYLCKTERVSSDIIECEVISACGYLEDDRISCALHHRLRPDGTPAKPMVCSNWPDLGPDDVGHPGCRLLR
ncbi:MAG: hypothetical protein HYY94_01575 [Gemmatimonadetes bacterium]|nr:hypothetical protein [Gemmatimonadota bacterium]